MRPLRIARRVLARARNWGGPHVHCPGCGADCPLPEDEALKICFTCRVQWFRHPLTGNHAADMEAIEAKVGELGEFTVVVRPLVVDVPGGVRGKKTELLNAAFVYLRGLS